jgi:hypothetical protein
MSYSKSCPNIVLLLLYSVYSTFNLYLNYAGLFWLDKILDLVQQPVIPQIGIKL